MGAFVTYLYLEHGIRHFFVLAPNLTIYNKLVADFTPNTQKYVFQGIAEFAVKSPALVTSDNFEERPRDPRLVPARRRRGQRLQHLEIQRAQRGCSENSAPLRVSWTVVLRLPRVTGRSRAHHGRVAPLPRRLEHEVDRTNSSRSWVLSSPRLRRSRGSKPLRFKNIIFNYPLAQALRDGFVKEPAVATRRELQAGSDCSATALERLKLEDGIRIHESAKVDLEVYAQQNDVRKVKPFMLVIAPDTDTRGRHRQARRGRPVLRRPLQGPSDHRSTPVRRARRRTRLWSACWPWSAPTS